MLSLNKTLKTYALMYKNALLLFWAIIFFIEMIRILIPQYFNDVAFVRDISSTTFMAEWLFIVITSIINATNVFSMMMNYSVTRKKYYQSTVIWSIMISFLMAVMATILTFSKLLILPLIGIEITKTASLTPIYLLYHLFTTNFLIVALSLIIGALFYLYHVVAGLALLLVYATLFYQYVYPNFENLALINYPMWLHNHFMLLIACVLFGVAWLLYRRVSITAKK